MHDVLADHTDISAQASAAKPGSVSKTGFNCDRLDLVAESPFIAGDVFVESDPVQFCTDFIILSDHAAAHKAITLPSLRGPPCI